MHRDDKIIVQFLGLHFSLNQYYPTLVMEKLAMSLDDLLIEAEKKKEELPLSLKVSILSDTAKGLASDHPSRPHLQKCAPHSSHAS